MNTSTMNLLGHHVYTRVLVDNNDDDGGMEISVDNRDDNGGESVPVDK